MLSSPDVNSLGAVVVVFVVGDGGGGGSGGRTPGARIRQKIHLP